MVGQPTGNPLQQEELLAMKEDIANRKFNVRLKGMIITGLFAAGAIAAAFLIPGGSEAAELLGGRGLLGLALAGGGAITTLATLKEIKKLELDEEYLKSYMQGKNYWGEGYREEVAEKGYGFGNNPQPFMAGAAPPQNTSKNHSIT